MKSQTVVVLIGNTDNKLSQQQWAAYVSAVLCEMRGYSDNRMHFTGGSGWDQPYQNACYVAEIAEDKRPFLMKHLEKLRARYFQESIAFIEGETQFIRED